MVPRDKPLAHSTAIILFETMFHFVRFDEMTELYGDETLDELLREIANTAQWKAEFPVFVSAGWHWIDSTHQVHYISNVATSVIAAFLMEQNIPYDARPASSDETTPLDILETWELPGNQEEAISLGYFTAPVDYCFIRASCYHNPFGGFRSMPPAI